MKRPNNFQIAKVQPRGIAQLLLDFMPVSAWRCLQKCCLYKKAYSSLENTSGAIKIRDSHLTGKVANKCLNVRGRLQVPD